MVHLAVISKTAWSDLIDDFLLHVLATQKASTEHSYRAQLRLFHRWAVERDVKPDTFRIRDMDAYIVYRQGNGLSRTTQRYDAIIIRAMFTYGLQTNLIGRNPLKDYKIITLEKKEEFCPNKEQASAILRAVETRWNPRTNPKSKYVLAEERKFYRLRDFAIISGLLGTGMRISEMLSLNLEDVDTETLVASVKESKTNDFRKVPFTAAWAKCLAEWRKVRPRCQSQRLFVSAYGDEMNCNTFGASFREYRQIGELPTEFSCHSCRHYAITVLCETDIKAAQGIAGHKSLATTNKYSHTNEEHKKLKMTEADPLGKILVNRRTEAQNEAKAKREKLIKK
ncbi:MAG: Tyrosine recombinase xerC [Chthonomonadales bacterium]|nr:Tyrosine recombinase xerC [Chthonomonadales bacterium]